MKRVYLKNVGILALLIVITLGMLFYVRPLPLSAVINEQQYIDVCYIESGFKNGTPHIDATNPMELSDEQKKRIIHIIYQYFYRRNLKTLFSDGSTSTMNEEAINIYVSDDEQVSDTIFIGSSEYISLNGKTYYIPNASTLIDELLVVIGQ